MDSFIVLFIINGITSILAWIVMHAQACAKNTNIYQLKNQPLKDFQMQMWRRPYTVFT